MAELSGIVPARYIAPIPTPTYEQFVFFNWLEVEIDPHVAETMSVLESIHGWRNRHVYDFVSAHKEEFYVRHAAHYYG